MEPGKRSELGGEYVVPDLVRDAVEVSEAAEDSDELEELRL